MSASLAFTTLISLVPLLALVLSIISVFPPFSSLVDQADQLLVRNLLPERSAGVIAKYMVQFSQRAAKVTAIGLALLTLTACLMLHSIERAFNHVWRVSQPRPWWQRLRLYAVVLALWPAALIAVGAALSFAVTASLGFVDEPLWVKRWVFKGLGVLILTLFFALLYHAVPNAEVARRHAAWAGLVAALGFSLMQKGFELYLAHFPSYTAIYGAFATVPIFLVWLYLSWAVVLVGALVAVGLSERRH